MYLIVGLGNPEEEYSKTRHNMGFDTVNKIAKEYNINFNKNKFKGIYGTGIIENEKVILLKPQTYMNLSGESIIQIMNFYKMKPDELIIIYDDIDIEPSHIKIRKKGGAGSHNGMKSVVSMLGTEEFTRIRVGIGCPENKRQMIDYVIGKISEDELKILSQGTTQAKDAVIEIIKNGVDSAMNKFN